MVADLSVNSCLSYTIADFRKNNAAGFKKAFKAFVAFLKGENLFDGKVIAVDGTRTRAQNNKKNNFNEAKFAKSLAYIETQVSQYIQELDDCDAREDKQAAELKKKDVAKKIEELKARKEHYTALKDEMTQSGEKQMSMPHKGMRFFFEPGRIATIKLPLRRTLVRLYHYAARRLMFHFTHVYTACGNVIDLSYFVVYKGYNGCKNRGG